MPLKVIPMYYVRYGFFETITFGAKIPTFRVSRRKFLPLFSCSFHSFIHILKKYMTLCTHGESTPPRTPDRGVDGLPVRKKLSPMTEECKSVAGEMCGCYGCVEKACLERRYDRLNRGYKDIRKEKKILALRMNRLKRLGLVDYESDPEFVSAAESAGKLPPDDTEETDSNASQAGFSDQDELNSEDAAHVGGETYVCGDCGSQYNLGAQCKCGY